MLLEDEGRDAAGYSRLASVVNKRRRVEEEESVTRIYRRQCRCRILARGRRSTATEEKEEMGEEGEEGE